MAFSGAIRVSEEVFRHVYSNLELLLLQHVSKGLHRGGLFTYIASLGREELLLVESRFGRRSNPAPTLTRNEPGTGDKRGWDAFVNIENISRTFRSRTTFRTSDHTYPISNFQNIIVPKHADRFVVRSIICRMQQH